MSAATYRLNADASMAATPGCPPGGSTTGDVNVDQSFTIVASSARSYQLLDDDPVTIDLPGPTSDNPDDPQAGILIVQVQGPPVKALVTTDYGTAQAIPIDPLLILHSTTDHPITALTLTRTAGNDTFVNVFAGQT
jgi:hypothetical protein